MSELEVIRELLTIYLAIYNSCSYYCAEDIYGEMESEIVDLFETDTKDRTAKLDSIFIQFLGNHKVFHTMRCYFICPDHMNEFNLSLLRKQIIRMIKRELDKNLIDESEEEP